MVTHSQVSNTQKDHKVKVSSGYIVNLCLKTNKIQPEQTNNKKKKTAQHGMFLPMDAICKTESPSYFSENIL